MLSHLAKLEVQIGERKYQFICDNESPMGAVHDALTAMKSYVLEKMQEAEKAACDGCKKEDQKDE